MPDAGWAVGVELRMRTVRAGIDHRPRERRREKRGERPPGYCSMVTFRECYPQTIFIKDTYIIFPKIIMNYNGTDELSVKPDSRTARGNRW